MLIILYLCIYFYYFIAFIHLLFLWQWWQRNKRRRATSAWWQWSVGTYDYGVGRLWLLMTGVALVDLNNLGLWSFESDEVWTMSGATMTSATMDGLVAWWQFWMHWGWIVSHRMEQNNTRATNNSIFYTLALTW